MPADETTPAVDREAFAAVLEELYALPPGEFTGVRNGHARRLRGEGDRVTAERVARLRKPAAAAWLVNMLVRHEDEEVATALDLGDGLRQAQADLDGQALRELSRQRRRLVTAITGGGRSLARDLGHPASDRTLLQVEETLNAAMLDAEAAAAVRTGMLVDALSTSGLGTLRLADAVADHTALGEVAGSASRPGPTPEGGGTDGSGRSNLSVVPEADADDREHRREQARRRARERVEAQQRLEAVEAELAESERELAQRSEHRETLRAATLQVNGELDELHRQVVELEDRLESLDEELAEAGALVEEGEVAVTGVRTARDEARQSLEAIPEDRDEQE